MYGPPLAGRYAIQRELGSGANARIYLAFDQKMGRTVAVKVLDVTAGASPEAVQRLEREGRVSAAINHPHVCAVYDVGRLDNGLPFLVMEHLTGETLADRCAREHPLPVGVAVDFAMQMLLGLHAAHRVGIVHRDLKPANTFLVDLGLGRQLLKLLDFGTTFLTGNLSASSTLTQAGLVVGTPEYMAPEQVRGLRDFDARTDVYACGVVLYEMLAGQRPFGALPIDQVAEAIAFRHPPPLAEVAPFVPPVIARAVDVALSVNPRQRHTDAAAFLAALSETHAVEAPPTAGIEAIARPTDDWELLTLEEASTPEAVAPTVALSEWEIATHESGPPSAMAGKTSPMATPLVPHPPASDAVDNAMDDGAVPTKKRR